MVVLFVRIGTIPEKASLVAHDINHHESQGGHMAKRPLGLVKDLLAVMGLGFTYAYEDLVFVEHNAFLLQFADTDEAVGLHVNADCPDDQLAGLVAEVVRAGAAVGLTVTMRGRYEMRVNDQDETFSVHFC
ncbi:MAG: hypothetical protein CVU60_01325 [Deltaproteobacteria bacterium HGW-Deltaproteobacteria-18]|jgi:hypothetical protein|nr:MAG: hypothetical protein CVU60_01325 [Deltaproteobacteria bacterium HGW-Deltaproteobacteria-18]